MERLRSQRQTVPTRTPSVESTRPNAADSLNRAVYHKTGGLVDLWTAALIVLAVIGVKRVFSEKGGTLPGGGTLLWWAYTALLAG